MRERLAKGETDTLAYIEVKRGDKLLRRKVVKESAAKAGYEIRIGGERVCLRIGDVQSLGSLTVSLHAGDVPEQVARSRDRA